jgi:hypothetical protein
LSLKIRFNNGLILAYVTDSKIKIRKFDFILDILYILNYVQIALSFDHGTFFCFSFVLGFYYLMSKYSSADVVFEKISQQKQVNIEHPK